MSSPAPAVSASSSVVTQNSKASVAPKAPISTALPKEQLIQFVALISRNDKPLYIQSFNIESKDGEKDGALDSQNANKFLKYNFLSHMALDIFSAPASLSLREQQHQGETANGVLLLFIQDEIAVYGYETNNGLKIVVGLSNSPSINETDSRHSLKNLFLDIHRCYLRTICNPFNNLSGDVDINENDTALQTSTFDNNIKKIVNQWNI
ncbi:Sedlin, N-terminal conserved region-domain-containing protein [Scheffersomyces xylosifermentans]|uniref:Sedlin, N-terminal conserved region-domain-containing protein n=1 Tax=Scheffersomyces xylosifermentans TaxID=1304137 RepID=UPI00315CA477